MPTASLPRELETNRRFFDAVALDLAEQDLAPGELTLDVIAAAMRARLQRDCENADRVLSSPELVSAMAEDAWRRARGQAHDGGE